MEESTSQQGSLDAASTSLIKVLPAAVIREIELQNKLRRQMGLSGIQVKIRNCLQCGHPFQSAGRRTCGCNTAPTGRLSGHDII
ncbi:hypothetical protein [Oligoflexus sp.]|uniref:hypothetical protein n=1 Tax=Oligoflexus sp. TaxID=1971216 RepID=UPI002D77A5C5|nr:hypothetical protein [Oligoflexus sp.]